MGRSAVDVDYDDRGVTRVPVAQGAPGTTLLASAQLGKRHSVVGALLTLSADGTLKFTGSADLTGPMDIAAKGGFAVPRDAAGLIQAAPNTDLSIVTSGGGANGVVAVLTEAI